MTPQPRPVALTIAGSDSGGGAGIQADLRVFHRLGVFGTSAITAVTAQNLRGVTDVVGLPANSVRAQIDAVTQGFAVRALKTGMLWSAEIVAEVADAMSKLRIPAVVDPVMVATSGARLLSEDAIANYRRLIPQAALVTPNLDEAAVLLNRLRIDPRDLRASAEQLSDQLGTAVLLKGGHLQSDPVDVLCHGEGVVAWHHPRVNGVNTHGSGCMLAAAIAARLAHGDGLVAAVERGLGFVHDALAQSVQLGGDVELADVERAEPETTILRRVEL